MASSRFLQFLLLVLLALVPAQATNEVILTIVNNCPFTIWPAIQPDAGHAVPERGGFALPTLAYRSFSVSSPWSGRVWGRTGCAAARGHFACSTGDCGRRLECGGVGGETPATLAQFSLDPSGAAGYSVSLVDGFNLPMTVTPHEGRGRCPVVGCRAELLGSCPAGLQARRTRGSVVACKSGCEAYNTDELCCRNRYSSPPACRPSSCSEFFKQACPSTLTYAHDTSSLPADCAAPRELKVIFCH